MSDPEKRQRLSQDYRNKYKKLAREVEEADDATHVKPAQRVKERTISEVDKDDYEGA